MSTPPHDPRLLELLVQAPGHGGAEAALLADWLETPPGAMLAVADTTHLHLLEFADRTALPRELERLQASVGAGLALGQSLLLDALAAELATYFQGESACFRTPLTLTGTLFTRRVWAQLQTIPAGTTQSYGRLASDLGQPAATRAVARANGANQLAIVIPCHRVIGHDGSLTGHAGGLWRKQWLLEHEKRHFSGQGTLY